MNRWGWASVSGVLAAALVVGASPAAAQWLRPQSDRDLKLTWEAQRLGPSRVLMVGDVRNLSDSPASHVVLLAEGLDRAGRVVSRARGFVAGEVPPGGSSPFEIRLTASGAERRYRVTIDSFEFEEPAAAGIQSP